MAAAFFMGVGGDAKRLAAFTMPAMMEAKELEVHASAPRRRWVMLFVAAFLLAQLLLPLRYYIGSQSTDERFAWRMFSSVHLRDSHGALYETVEIAGQKTERQVPAEMLSPWQSLLNMGRHDVAFKLMRWWCARPGVLAVRYELRSQSPDGTPLPTLQWRLDRATGSISEIGRDTP